MDLREEAFFIVMERKILITRTKVNKRAYWLVKNTPPFYLNLNLRDAQLESFFSALFLLLVGSGSKKSMPIEKLDSSSLVFSIFLREGQLHCTVGLLTSLACSIRI